MISVEVAGRRGRQAGEESLCKHITGSVEPDIANLHIFGNNFELSLIFIIAINENTPQRYLIRYIPISPRGTQHPLLLLLRFISLPSS